jgi:hypothetical protein
MFRAAPQESHLGERSAMGRPAPARGGSRVGRCQRP